MRSLRALKKFENFKVADFPDIIKDIKQSKKILEPLTESDILDLEDKFLINGFHYISVKSIRAGRSLVFRFLRSLNCYQDEAILSMSTPTINDSVADIYYELVRGGHVDATSGYNLNEFFIGQFYYDFMWIEASEELVAAGWFTQFFEKMVNFKLNYHLPVLIISYQK